MKPLRALLLVSPIVGLGVVGVVAFKTGASLGEVTTLIPLPFHLGALVAFLLSLLGRGGRLVLLARGLGGRLPLRGAVATQLSGEAAAAATPSRSGSDPVRLLYLGRLGVDLPTGMAVLVGEIMAEGVVLTAVITVLLVLLPGSTGLILGALPYAATALAMPFLAFFLVRRPGKRDPPALWRKVGLGAIRWRKLRAGAWRFRSKARGLARLRTGTIAGVLLVSAVHMVARLSVLPILVAGVAPETPLAPVVAWPLLLLYTGSLLPPPGGGGTVEVTFAAGLGSVLGAGRVAGLLLWWRLYTFYLGAVAGALLLAFGLGRAGLKALGTRVPESRRVEEGTFRSSPGSRAPPRPGSLGNVI